MLLASGGGGQPGQYYKPGLEGRNPVFDGHPPGGPLQRGVGSPRRQFQERLLVVPVPQPLQYPFVQRLVRLLLLQEGLKTGALQEKPMVTGPVQEFSQRRWRAGPRVPLAFE